MPDHVTIFDTTLRDGEQSPGIALDADQKVTIATQLAKLGVDVVEAGFPASSPGDFAAVRRIAREVAGPTIAALARATPGDVDRAWEAIREAAKPRIHVFLATSPIHMEHKLQMTPDEVMAAVKSNVARAREYAEDVEFSPEDATRSDPEFVVAVCRGAVEAGATTINIPDTVGYATPRDFGALIRKVVADVKGSRDDVVISAHCHNDLGLAVANSLAAVENGARQVEGAINGIGERAGNTSIEEVVMALMVREDVYGVEVGIDTKEIYPTSRLVSELTGYPIQYNKAVVGRNAFAHESGIHQHGVLRARATYEIMQAEAVGQEGSKIVLGKHSGRAALKHALDGIGVTLTDEAFQVAFVRLKELADRGVEITEDELHRIVEASTSLDWMMEMNAPEATPFVRARATAETEVASGEVATEPKAQTNGRVESTFETVKEAFGSDAQLLGYNVRALQTGGDSLAETQVWVRVNQRVFTGVGVATDLAEGSARAFTAALSKAASPETGEGGPGQA